MKIEILVSDDRKTYSIAVDGGPPALVENFVLLTKEGEKTRNVVFGSAENVGRLLYGFYVNCWRLDARGMRDALELVAGDIVDVREKRNDASQQTIRRIM
ncbi:MAG: hypothetical protein HY896_06345 [Deltaproteobacteria bacterium]|nr:hypothetical protein [Deltaproteobacteria bacterium]